MGKLDVSIKHAISAFPDHWAEFVGVRHGAPIQVVDSDVSALSNIADKVLLVQQDEPLLLHLEPQGYYDERLDERMMAYNALLRRRHRVFVHTAVLALDRRAWGPANTGGLTGESPLGHCRLDFRYEVIKVWELPVERILGGGVGVLPLAPIVDVPEIEIPQVIEQIGHRFDRELPRAEAAEFWTATFILVGLKYDQSVAARVLRGVHDTMQESSTYRWIIEQGETRGQIKAKQDDLILLGTRRFDPPDSQTLTALRAITDFDRLDAMLLRVLDAAGWDEVLAAE